MTNSDLKLVCGANLVFANFRSTCPDAWKSGLITSLLKRAKIICSDYELFKDKITKPGCISPKIVIQIVFLINA